MLSLISHYLYSVSLPDKYGTPQHDLSKDNDIHISSHNSMTRKQMLVERVIHKVFNHYSIPVKYISNCTRNVFQRKLYKMGIIISRLNGPKRKKQIGSWVCGRLSTWLFNVSMKDVNMHLQKKNDVLKAQLVEAQEKSQHFEKEYQSCTLESARLCTELDKVRMLTKNIVSTTCSTSNEACTGTSSRQPRKKWQDYTRQHRALKKKRLGTEVKTSLSLCNTAPFTPTSVQLHNNDTNQTVVFNIEAGKFSSDEEKRITDQFKKVASTLYVKDKFAIPDRAYLEMSQLTSDLPRTYELKKLAKGYDDEIVITSTPNGIVGVQQSLRDRLNI